MQSNKVNALDLQFCLTKQVNNIVFENRSILMIHESSSIKFTKLSY